MRFWTRRKIIKEGHFEPTYSDSPVSRSRSLLFAGVIGSITLVLFAQAFRLSVTRGQELTARYEEIHNQKEWILSPRGLIIDRNGVTLALNAPGKKANEFSRLYPAGNAFSNLLGFIGRISPEQLGRDDSYLPFDLIGKEGVEAAYESYLRGKHGSVEKPIKVQGQEEQNVLVNEPVPGNEIVLTIDAQMQKKLFEIVEAQVKKFNTPGGAAVVLNPSKGEVLSLVSLPTFDNNAITTEVLNDPQRPLFNRAISGMYPPGSTVKPFLAAAALKEHIIKPETIIHDTGKVQVKSIYDPNIVWTFRGWKALGNVDMRRALAFSSNIYFFTIGGGYGGIKGLGIDRLKQYYTLFGFSGKTGIDILGEEEGFVPTPQWKKETFGEQWFIGDTFNTSIGQGFVKTTPLQLAAATVALANHGTLYRPYVVNRILGQDGAIIFSQKPLITNPKVMDDAYLQVAREGMRKAVTEGTMWRLRDFPIPVAGKTGTSQAGAGKPYHGWVTIMFPYEDPEIVLTILIENGEGGEQSAVPAAKEFLEWYVQHRYQT